VALPAGVNIVATNPVNSDNIQPLTLNNQFLNFLVGSFPTTIQLVGEVVDFPQAAVIWTATDSSGNTTAIGVGNTVNWTVPSPGGFFTITMGASDSHFNPIGTATMTANVELTPR
jgi:hypothetical protein